MVNGQKQTYCLEPISEAQQCDKPCNFRRVCLERFSDYIYTNLSRNPELNEKLESSNHQIISQKS